MGVAASITEFDAFDEEIQLLTTLVGPENVPGLLRFAAKVPLNHRREWFAQLIESIVSPATAAAALEYKYKPVGIEEFLLSSFYLNKRSELYPVVLKELLEINSGKYDEVILTGAIGCWPADAEVLTPTGFVRMDEYAGQDVAEYDPQSGRVAFCVPEYVVKPADGWWLFERQGFSKKVSPEHTVLLNGMSGASRVVRAHELGSGVVNRDSYAIPSTFTINRPGAALSDDQLRLMVAVLADGNFHPGLAKDNPRCRVTIRKQRKRERLESLLGRLDLEWHMTGPYPARPTEVTYHFDAPLRTKQWGWAWECSTKQLGVLFDEIPHWDGLHPSSSPTGEWRFHTALPEARDFVQYLCQATGHRARIRCVKGSGNRRDQWFVQARLSDGQAYKLRATTATWQAPEPGEKKFCFVTKSGFFIARYHGNVMVSGNTAKTSIALYSQAYQIYLLSCLDSPHKLFKLDSSSEIKVVFQNLNAKLAKGVDYARFRALIAGSQYFRTHFPYKQDVESMILFPNRIEVEPVAGTETAAIGQNVIGGIIDEVNFMQVIEHSKQSTDGGAYNQAMALYQTIASRRKSRFMQAGGTQPGLLCLVSSKRVPGQFTDIKEAEAKNNKRIYVYNKRVWDLKPDVYCGKTFKVFVGDEYRRPKVLDDGEIVPETDRELVDDIPVEHYDQFAGPGVDIVRAVRDVAGRSSLASYPFMADRELVNRCFSRRANICVEPSVDFAQNRAQLVPSLARLRPECPRWCHIDLAISKDHAGVAIGHVPGFKSIERADGLKERLPIVEYDLILDVAPPPGGEINFAKIRVLLYKLRELGLPIRWVSFDQFQSTDSQQILTSQGFTTGYLSMDRTNVPYDVLKQALYDDRVIAPKHDKLYRELVTLEIDLKKGKVDHPANSSKDVADAAAGVAFGLSMRREIWAQYDVPVVVEFVRQAEAVRSKNAIRE